jgi:hypothetical protein
MITWTLNDSSLETLGLTLAAGNFRVQAVSTMTLQRACNFDATEALSYGTAAILALDGTPYFQGKVVSVPKFGSGSDEGQVIEIADAWTDLEETIYQEEWATGITAVLQPRAVLGMGKIDAVWTYLTVAQQVKKILDYAISQGVNLAVGTIPTGERLLPTEVSNISCAEAVQMALKFHPDWIPWIDHSTTPPTFNVTPIGTATGAAFSVDGTGPVIDFELTARSDLLPESVRIVYETANEIDAEVYRKVYVDKYPADGPDGGPQVLTATIPLAGMSAQVQKSRIQTRTLPTSQATAKPWLKEKFPAIAAVADEDLFVKVWSLELVTEDDEDFPPPVSPQAERMAFTNVSQATHELVRGTMEDWMRRKVGPVRVYFELACRPSVPQALRDIVKTLPPAVIITGTNATTKTFKTLSHWSAAEEVPTGSAQAIYTAIHAAMPYQGSVTIAAEELPPVPYHGRVISLPPTWPGIACPVHSVDWDVASGTARLSFGPAPHLAPADFLEMQRILRARPVTWWSFAERDSSQIGDEDGPSAHGDTVTGHDIPKTEPSAPVPPAEQFEVSTPFADTVAETWHVRAEGGWVLGLNPEIGAGSVTVYLEVSALSNQTIVTGSGLWVKVTTDKMDLPTAAVWHYATTAPDSTHAQPDPSGQNGEYFYHVCSFVTVGDNVVIQTGRGHLGGPIIHRPARNNRNLDLTIHNFWENSDGYLTQAYLDSEDLTKVLSWRQGLYVGFDAGAADNLDEADAINLVAAPELPPP